MRTYRARRPNGAALLIDEYWDFVDTSPRYTGESFVPGMKRLAARNGGEVRQLDDTTFQLVETAELLREAEAVSTGTRQPALTD